MDFPMANSQQVHKSTSTTAKKGLDFVACCWRWQCHLLKRSANRVHARRTCQQLVSKQRSNNKPKKIKTEQKQTTNRRQQTADGKLLTANSKQQQLDQQTVTTTQWSRVDVEYDKRKSDAARKIARKLQINECASSCAKKQSMKNNKNVYEWSIKMQYKKKCS